MQGETQGEGEVSRNSSAAAGGEGQVVELLGRAQGCHQHLLEQEQQWLLAQGCPRPQGQPEVRAGPGQGLGEEALVKQMLWHLSDGWGMAGLGQGVAGSRGSRARWPATRGSLMALAGSTGSW